MDILARNVLAAWVNKDSARVALKQAIEQVIRTEFGDATVNAVHVMEDRDYDDDTVLRVVIVFEPSSKPDVGKAASLVRHLRPVLEAQESNAFPLVAFRSKADHDRLSEAA